jgi:hypothetical protein
VEVLGDTVMQASAIALHSFCMPTDDCELMEGFWVYLAKLGQRAELGLRWGY